MLNRKIKDKLNDTEEELRWLRGYVIVLENGIEDIRRLINESEGVVGYHLNGNIATWDEVIQDSEFYLAEDFIVEKRKYDTPKEIGHVTTEARNELYIKTYKNLPCTIAYTPVYGGEKYVKVKK